MKKAISLFLFLLPIIIAACPTCTGRITPGSPPFFSDELYQSDTEGMDELYQAIIDTQQDTTLTTTAPLTQKEKK